MSIWWATADDSAELVTEPGEIQDERGTRNDGPALWIAPRGTDAGVVVEGSLSELAGWLSRALLQVRAAAGPDLGEAPDEPTALVLLSRWIDAGNAGRDPEAVTWGRLAKLSEETGEVIAAFTGVTGQNPRKGVSHTVADVLAELLDVAITALGAYEHLTGHQGRALHDLDTSIVATAIRAGVVQ